MASLLDFCGDMPLSTVEPGTELLTEGHRTGRLLVLAKGRIEILRGANSSNDVERAGLGAGRDVDHARRAAHGDGKGSWTGRDLRDRGWRGLPEGKPGRGIPDDATLAKRLNSATTYLVDLKRQFAGENNHLEMVGEVLESLIFQQQRRELKPGSDRDPRLP